MVRLSACLLPSTERLFIGPSDRLSSVRPFVRPSIYSHRSCVRVYHFCRLFGRECVSFRLCFRVGFHRRRFVFLDFELFRRYYLFFISALAYTIHGNCLLLPLLPLFMLLPFSAVAISLVVSLYFDK